MSNRSSIPDNVNVDKPLSAFSQCHAGILSKLQALGELPALAAAARQARFVAADSLTLFKHAVINHHAEEEGELFPAVVRSALPGKEHDVVQMLVGQLTSEHRIIEALWKRVEPAISVIAKGKEAEVEGAVVAELIETYNNHARLEETQFLPLAETILGRNNSHMAALGMSLHARHVTIPPGRV